MREDRSARRAAVSARLSAAAVTARPVERLTATARAALLALVATIAVALPLMSSQPTLAALVAVTLVALVAAWSGSRARAVPALVPARVGARHRYDLTPSWQCPDAPRTPRRPGAPGQD